MIEYIFKYIELYLTRKEWSQKLIMLFGYLDISKTGKNIWAIFLDCNLIKSGINYNKQETLTIINTLTPYRSNLFN